MCFHILLQKRCVLLYLYANFANAFYYCNLLGLDYLSAWRKQREVCCVFMIWDYQGWSKLLLYQAGWVGSAPGSPRLWSGRCGLNLLKQWFQYTGLGQHIFLLLVFKRRTSYLILSIRTSTLSFCFLSILSAVDYSYWAVSELWWSKCFDPASSPKSALVLWHCRRSNRSRPCSAGRPLPGRPVLQPKWTGGFRWGACVIELFYSKNKRDI